MLRQQPQRIHTVNVEDEQIHTDALHKLPRRLSRSLIESYREI
jgi:hypothetical protein